MNAAANVFYIVVLGGVVEEFAIVISDKAHTTCTGCNNVIGPFKVFDKLTANGFGFIPKTGIERRLTTAGLFNIIGNCTTSFFQYFDHVESCFREKLIDKAGYKKLNVHARFS